MRAIERTIAPPALCQALDRLYAACQLPPPAVLVAHEIEDFTRLVRIAGRPRFVAAGLMCAALVATYAGFASFAAIMGKSHPSDWAVGLLFAACAVGAIVTRPSFNVPRDADKLPSRLIHVAAALAVVLIGGLVAAATGSWSWCGAGALWAAAAACALLALQEGTGGLFKWLRPRLWPGTLLPLTAAVPIRGQMQPRLRSAVAAAIAQHGRSHGVPASVEGVDNELAAAFERAGLFRTEVGPLLGRGLRGWNRQGVDEAADMADPPLLVAAAIAVDRACLAVTLFDRVAVALLPPEPDRRALPTTPSETAGRALDALLLPWPYPTLARRLPLRWGERLAAWLVDRERDPILRFAAIERMGPKRLFDALGREPADSGPEGELYVAGAASTPTMMLRVVDLVPNEDGSERVHWISVPPHMVRASEAVAWSFGHSPGGYRPSMQS